MDKRPDTPAVATDTGSPEPAAAREPGEVLMSRLETLYEPRVVAWIHRVRDAARDKD